MNDKWNIGFEWIVTGAAVIGVIVLLIAGGDVGLPGAPGVAGVASSAPH